VEWTEDPGVVEALDRYLKESKDDLKDLLDALHPYSKEFPPVVNALLFGGIGQLVISYNEARGEANNPLQSLGLGMESVTRNPRFQVLINGLIDQKVGSVLEGNE
jgi:hypothetical protein